jgi:aspartyl-tRNA(Asn)/glutamyl-tRNA(Gln) amidotransferase subunit C
MPMSAITRDDVAHLAMLARLSLTEDELVHYAGQLDVILDAVATVSEAVDDSIEPMTHAVPVTNVVRRDEVVVGLSADEALAGAPASEDGRFRVPRILDEE